MSFSHTDSASPSAMLKLLIFLLLAASYVTARCYFPDGTLDTKSFVCNTTAVDNGGSSACCLAGDDCYDSGTCYQGWSGIAYRNTCTDPTWKSRACPQFCLESDMLDAGIWIQSCDLRTRSACCLVGSANCCNDTTKTFTYAPGILVAVLGNPGGQNMLSDNSNTTTTTTVSNTCSSATISPNLPAAAESSSSGITHTDAVAIIIGTILGAAFVLTSAGMLYFRRKYHLQKQHMQSSDSAPAVRTEYHRDTGPARYGNVHFKPHQLDSTETARYPELQG